MAESLARTRYEIGTEAEAFVASHVACPSCGNALRPLAPGYPMYDVECTRCLLRAQVKRIAMAPRDRIRGASWDVLRHHVRTGHLLPPMFACFGWPSSAEEPQTVWFFPLIPVTNLRKRVLSERHQTPGRKMAEYVDMRAVPHFVVFCEGATAPRATRRSSSRR
jgi:hypothetical protein